MTGAVRVAAVDLGATSGRVIVGEVGPDRIDAALSSRFDNRPVLLGGTLHWDVLSLWRGAVDGLAGALREDPGIRSVGVCSWGVDYGLLRGGRLLANPVHYRDPRTEAVVDRVHAQVSPGDLQARTGAQPLAINTVYQLVAEAEGGLLDAADAALLTPDLFAFWLSGVPVAERTIASTTGLLSLETGDWDRELIARLDLPPHLLARVVAPGTRIGPLAPAVADQVGASPGADVVAVGAHDTASAAVATPLPDRGGVFVSCGTWGLVGVERVAPPPGAEAFAAGFTTERGVDDRFLVMRNGMGLWILTETLRGWEREGESVDLPDLLARAAEAPGDVPVFDVEDPRFQAPGDMPARIAAWCAEHGLRPPEGRTAIVRSIVESLARALADAAHEAARLAGEPLAQINLVGGGSRNALLCARLADLAGATVLAGPVEATALGSLLVQARTAGAVAGTIDDLRGIVARTFRPRRFPPGRSGS